MGRSEANALLELLRLLHPLDEVVAVALLNFGALPEILDQLPAALPLRIGILSNPRKYACVLDIP